MEILTPTHCLDACAVITYLRKESGVEILKEVIERPSNFLVMHVCRSIEPLVTNYALLSHDWDGAQDNTACLQWGPISPIGC